MGHTLFASKDMPQKKFVTDSVSSAGITQIRFKGYLLSLVGTPAQFLCTDASTSIFL